MSALPHDVLQARGVRHEVARTLDALAAAGPADRDAHLAAARDLCRSTGAAAEVRRMNGP